MNYLKSLYLSYRHNVDAHLGEFTKLVQKLEAAVGYHKAVASEKNLAGQNLLMSAETSLQEAMRAQNVADKFKELVS